MFDVCKYPFSQKWFIDDDEAYFIEIGHSWLFKTNLSDHTCELLETFSEDGFKRFSACHKIRNTLWCFPDISDHGWLYNLEEHEYQKFDIPMCLKEEKSRLGIDKTWNVREKKFAAVFPLAILLEFDLQNTLFNVYKPDLGDGIDSWNEDDSECDDHYIYLISKLKNSIYKFDVLVNTFERIDIIGVEGSITNIIKTEDAFVLGDDIGNVYIWNGHTDKCEKICSLGIHLLHSICVDNACLFIPERGNSIYQILPDGRHEEIRVVCRKDEQNDASFEGLDDRYSLMYSRDNRYVGVYSCLRRNLIEYDALLKEFNSQYCVMNDSAYGVINRHNQSIVLDESFEWQRNIFWNEMLRK